MIRKNIRLRREYLFKIKNSKKIQEKQEKKRIVKNCLLQNKVIPTEFQKEEKQIKNKLLLEDERTLLEKSNIDDEYNISYTREPKILITSSRKPSQKLQEFSKEISQIFPNSIRINRGQTKSKEVIQLGISNDFTDVIILHEHRGEPDGLIISHLPLGPTIYFGIQGAIMRHDIKEKADPMSLAYPHLIFECFQKNKLSERIINIIKHLFPIPKFESKRIFAFQNINDIISFRHYIYDKEDYKTIKLKELGPRFELKPYQIILGTIGQPEAVKEWVLRPFLNTAYKHQNL